MNVIMGSHCKGSEKVGATLQQLVDALNSVVPNGYINVQVKSAKGVFTLHGKADTEAPKAPGRKAQA